MWRKFSPPSPPDRHRPTPGSSVPAAVPCVLEPDQPDAGRSAARPGRGEGQRQRPQHARREDVAGRTPLVLVTRWWQPGNSALLKRFPANFPLPWINRWQRSSHLRRLIQAHRSSHTVPVTGSRDLLAASARKSQPARPGSGHRPRSSAARRQRSWPLDGRRAMGPMPGGRSGRPRAGRSLMRLNHPK